MDRQTDNPWQLQLSAMQAMWTHCKNDSHFDNSYITLQVT